MTTSTSDQRVRRHGFAAVAASAAVMVVAIGFYGYAAALGTRSGTGGGYELEAVFLTSDGLRPGADVMLAGVPVGSVTSITLDQQSMTSHVRFKVEGALRLPVDTRLSIGSSTLTSNNALLIAAGTSSRLLAPGSVVTDTCGATNLEQQVSQYIFGNGGAPSGCGD